MNRSRNSSATKPKRRAYCACGHWQSNHNGLCLICACREFVEPQRGMAVELLYAAGPRAVLRKSKGARPEA